MLQTHIELYQDIDAGYLPPNLCMMELANRIDKNAKARVSQYGLSWANRMYGAADGWEDDDSTFSLIHVFSPAVYRADVSGRGREFCHRGAGNNRSSGGAQGGPHDNYELQDSTTPRG